MDTDIKTYTDIYHIRKREGAIVMEDRLEKITERIIGCSYTVSNVLGCGFLEKVYENALAHDLRKCGMTAHQQYPLKVVYDGEIVGEYAADLVVNNEIIVELKAAKALDNIHMAQCINYLNATGFKVCLLINFGTPRIEVKRILG